MDDLQSLNEAQRAAVTHVSGPMLVVAGAGTGKTKVITSRISYLIKHGHAKASEILALTFTEKAAREMSERLSSLIGWEALSVSVMTFNAFGAQLLNDYGAHIGRKTSGGLLNEIQKSLLLMQRYDDIKFQYYGPQADTFAFVTVITDYIGKLQNAGVSARNYRSYVDELKVSDELTAADIAEQHDLASLYEAYEQAKQDSGTYDYDDQLALPLEILKRLPHLAARLGRRYKFILVDEYQDTSPVQDALLRELVPPGGNLFAVGDDDQAIYGFRGADITNILDFTAHYGVKIPVALVHNYRSGQPILDAAYRLIVNNNPERLETRLGLDKQLQGTHANGRVNFRAYRSPSNELAAVVDELEQRMKQGAQASDMAVLARSNDKLRQYANSLRQRGIPFAISTAVNIFEQRELIQLWYALNWVGHRAREEAIGHVAMGPYGGMTASDWRAVAERARNDLSGFEAALRAQADDGQPAAIALVGRLDAWRDWALSMSVGELAYRMVFEAVDDVAPVGQNLRERAVAGAGDVQLRIFRVFDDLARLFGQMNDYLTIQELTTGDRSLGGYLAVFPVPPSLEVSETDGAADGIQLLTVHAAKGLEFPVVYLVNTTESSWRERSGGGGLVVPPELQLRHDLPAVHEQRRLMYVAVTRAKTELIITAPVASEGGQKQKISQLVTELLGEEPIIEIEAETSNIINNSLQKIQRYAPLQSQLSGSLPYEQADGWIQLSVSDLYAYSRDPHTFMLEKILKLGEVGTWKAAFGVLIHALIQTYYEGVQDGMVPTRDELLQSTRDKWSTRGFETPAQAEAGLKLAQATMARFYDREQATPRVIRAIEHPLSLEISEAKLRVTGRIDAMFDTADGLEVRDFKTGDKRDEVKLAEAARDSFQLRTYALGLQELSGQAPAIVTLDYVVTGAEGSAKLSPLIIKNHRDKLAKLAAGLRAHDFSPAPGSPGHLSLTQRYYGEGDDDISAE